MSIKETYDWYAKEGYLSANRQGGLTLYKYTSKCVLEGNWNFHTRTARGLVLDDSGKVIGRCYEKFFNLNERPETRAEVLPAETPELAEKYDGSLIISFWNPETCSWQGVTQKTWDNVQTRHANPWLAEHSEKLDPEFTYLFEIVGPWNRVVVLYPETRMVLIGVIHTESGEDWSYARVREFGLANGFDTVRFEKRPFGEIDFDAKGIVNEEGFVARFSNGFRVKVKYSQYVRLHKLLTQFSVKNLWEELSEGHEIDLSSVPAEFLEWFDLERARLLAAKKDLEDRAKEIFSRTPILATRKEYAAHFMRVQNPLPGILFRMLDGKDYEDILWKSTKPAVYRTFQKEEA